jgi:DNA-binding NarL/FixJ family response regulator
MNDGRTTPAASATDAGRTGDVLSVILADDDDQVRDALAEVIDEHRRLRLLATAADGSHAAALCASTPPDIAIVDVMMPHGGTEAVRSVLDVSPTTTVVVYTARSDRRTRQQLLDAGASLVIVKGSDVDIVDAVVGVAERRS